MYVKKRAKNNIRIDFKMELQPQIIKMSLPAKMFKSLSINGPMLEKIGTLIGTSLCGPLTWQLTPKKWEWGNGVC